MAPQRPEGAMHVSAECSPFTARKGVGFLLAVTNLLSAFGLLYSTEPVVLGICLFLIVISAACFCLIHTRLTSRLQASEAIGLDLTDQHRNVQTLEDNEQRMRLVLRATCLAFYDLDVVNNSLEMSPEYASMLGYAPATFVETKAKWLERVHPDDHRTVCETSEAYLRGELPKFEMEYRLRTQCGDWLWILSIGSIVARDSNGIAQRVLGILKNIDVRKRAEESLKASACRYRALFHSAAEGIHILDSSGKVVEVNPAFCDMLGYSYEEAIQLNVVDWDAQWSPAQLLSRIRQLLEQPAIFETRHRRKDGTVFDVEVTATAVVLDEQLYLYASSRDITSRTQSESELRDYEARLRMIFESVPECVRLIDADCKLLDINSAGLQILGASSREQVLGLNILEFVDANQQQSVRDSVAAVFRGESHELSFQGVSLDGRRLWMEQRAAPIWDPDKPGRVKEMLAVTRDISERMRTSQILRENQLLLAESQRIALLGSWNLNLITGQLDWSDQLYNIFEIEPTQPVRSDQHFLSLIHPEDRELVDAAHTRCLKDRQPYSVAHRLQMPDGRIKYVEEKCETDFDSDGTPLCSRGTIQDVTTRMVAEKAVLASLREKEAQMKEVRHRINNDFQVIISLLRLESVRSNEPATKEALSDLQGRIHSIATLHELLYRSRTVAAVDKATT